MSQSVAQKELRQAIEAVRTRAVESGDSPTTREIVTLSDALYTILDIATDRRQGLPFKLPPIGQSGEKS